MSTDRDTFTAVYAEHHQRLVRLAYLLTGDADAAEDVVADAFVKVWRQWRRGRVDDVGAYLRAAVANTGRSRLRRRYLEQRHAAAADSEDRGVLLHDQRAADRDEVFQALRLLSDGQRRVVVLRFYEDLTVEETARVLGVTTGTVKSQTSRAMDRLATVMEGVR